MDSRSGGTDRGSVLLDWMCLELHMVSDDEDFPISYLFYTVAVIALMGMFVVGAYFLLFG